jgi:hypothetical protein
MRSCSKTRRLQVERLEDRSIPGSVLDLLANPFLAPLGDGQSLVFLEEGESAVSLLLPGEQTIVMPSEEACPVSPLPPGDPCVPGPSGLVAATPLNPSSPIPGDPGVDVVLLADLIPAHSAQAAAGNVVSAFARDAQGVRVIWGESTLLDGARLATWALVSPHSNEVLAVGGSISLSLIENQPQPGSGPAGAIASLAFPDVVQQTTYFNHLEIHSQLHGHPISPIAADPNRYRVPHFDLHFYAVPEEQVRAIPGLPPPLPPVPADRLPAGYAQPGPSEPQMGRHAGPLSELAQTGPFSAVMIAGFTPNGTQMHFLEPMLTRELMLRREDFTLPVPAPAALGLATQFPTRFEATFHGNAYHFVFSDFVPMP